MILKMINIKKNSYQMPKRSSISIFIAATSALAISTASTNSVKSGENDLGGLKEWNTDMPIDADFVLDKDAQKLADDEIASALVAARNREIELFLCIHRCLFSTHFSKFREHVLIDV